MASETEMSWIERYAEERATRDPEFKAALDEEMAVLALVRARNAASMTQQEVAAALNVTQPYIAQIERGTKPMSVSLMMRYAHAVGVTVKIGGSSKARKKPKR